jgi:hypothetical protein
LSNNFKQTVANQSGSLSTRIDTLSTELASDVVAKVEKSVKASMANIIQQEIKKA